MLTLWLAVGLLSRQQQEQPPEVARGGSWIETDQQRRKRLKREDQDREDEAAIRETVATALRKAKGIKDPEPVALVAAYDEADDIAALLLAS
jgi:hypothetical protein